LKLLKKNLQIAIDGPVGAGKSVGAYHLAQKLNILYVYTGAMYRVVALLGINNEINLKNEETLMKFLKKSRIELKKPSKKKRVCDVILNGQDVTEQLFSSQVHWGSSVIAVLPKIRKYLIHLQKKMAENHAVVMEGRDITTVVLPKADLKIYLTASLEVRAKRKWRDLQKRGEKKTLKQVTQEVLKRDKQDKNRELNPLQISDDVWVLDTSDLTIKQEVDLIINKLKQKKLIN